MDMSVFNFTAPQLVFTGLLIRVNFKDSTVNTKTGEEFPAKVQLQLMCNIVSRDDSIRSEMVNLSLKDEDLFQEYNSLIGKIISVPVGYMVPEKGRGVIFWALQGNHPQVYNHTKPSGASSGSASGVKSPLAGG